MTTNASRMAFVPVTAASLRTRTCEPRSSFLSARQPRKWSLLKGQRSRASGANVFAMAGPARSTVCDTPVKEFLDKLKPLEKVRLIVRNTAGIMESIATFDGLFFASIRSGEYANLIDAKANLDLHLKIDEVSGARFDVGVSRSASKAPTYSIRLLGKDKEEVVLSVFLQWDKEPEDIAESRVSHWKQLKEEYAGPDGDSFFFD